MKKWDEITEEYLKSMPMNFVIHTGKSNDNFNQGIRRVPNGWIYYDKHPETNTVSSTYVPERERRET